MYDDEKRMGTVFGIFTAYRYLLPAWDCSVYPYILLTGGRKRLACAKYSVHPFSM